MLLKAQQFLAVLTLLGFVSNGCSFTPKSQVKLAFTVSSSVNSVDSISLEKSDVELPPVKWFPASQELTDDSLTTEQLKAQVLQLGAALDRGQAYNPTSGAYYSGVMLSAKKKIQELVRRADPEANIPKSLEDIAGEWELVLTTVPHGIFRSSPFFLAIQEAFEYAEDGSE